MNPITDQVGQMDQPRGRQQARSVQTTWLYTLASIVFFFVVLDAVALLNILAGYVASESLRDVVLMLLIVVAAVPQLRWCWFLRAGRGSGIPSTPWLVALFVPALAAWLLGLFVPDAGMFAALPLWMAVNVVAPLESGWRRWATLLAGAALTLAYPMLSARVLGEQSGEVDAGGLWLLIFYVGMLPIMVLSSLWWWEIVVKLDRHRALAANLAVAEERLRFASDLHDVQGHHLQVIALKSELAERMLDLDPEAAREHIHETRLIAKRALEETRSLVAGYREVALGDELENAREVLTAAGAQCDMSIGSLPSDAGARRVLGMVVREATTNVLRHSSATRVWIRLDASGAGSVLEIGNDGVNPGDRWGKATSSGLEGLNARVVSLGGDFRTQFDAEGSRFDLRAWVPERVGAGT